MKVETITQTIIKANEGYILTNGAAYGDTAVLGAGDSPDNWHEIPLEEYEAIKAEQEKEIN